MDKGISGVYTITNMLNNKIYVGYGIDIRKRFWGHTTKLKNNQHHNRHLQNAWNKHGEESFKFEILEEESIIEFLPSLENYWCNLLNTHSDEFGYNIAPTSPFGKISNSKESIELTRNKCIGKKRTKEFKEYMSRLYKGKSKPFSVMSDQAKKELYKRTSLRCKNKPSSRSLFNKEDILYMRNLMDTQIVDYNSKVKIFKMIREKYNIKGNIVSRIYNKETYKYFYDN